MSSYGLEVLDANGTVQMTVTDNLTRIVSVQSISGNGSYTNANLANGRIWCSFVPTVDISNTSYITVTVTGTNTGSTTVAWTYKDPTYSIDGNLLIGLY